MGPADKVNNILIQIVLLLMMIPIIILVMVNPLISVMTVLTAILLAK